MQQRKELPRSAITFSKGTELSIMLDEPNFTQADLIYYDYAKSSFNAVMKGESICIGQLPDDIAEDISSDMRLCLTALNDEGNMVVLDTRIQCLH